MILNQDLPSLAYWDAALAAFEARSPEERLAVEPLGALIDAEMAAGARRVPAADPSRPDPSRASPRSAPPAPPPPAVTARRGRDDAEARILDDIGVPARPILYTRADIDACRSDARDFRWPSACTVESCRRSGRCRGPLRLLPGAPSRMPACLRLLARRR